MDEILMFWWVLQQEYLTNPLCFMILKYNVYSNVKIVPSGILCVFYEFLNVSPKSYIFVPKWYSGTEYFVYSKVFQKFALKANVIYTKNHLHPVTRPWLQRTLQDQAGSSGVKDTMELWAMLDWKWLQFLHFGLKGHLEEVDHKMLQMNMVRVVSYGSLLCPLTASPGSNVSFPQGFHTSNVAVPNSPCHQGPAGNHIDSTQCHPPMYPQLLKWTTWFRLFVGVLLPTHHLQCWGHFDMYCNGISLHNDKADVGWEHHNTMRSHTKAMAACLRTHCTSCHWHENRDGMGWGWGWVSREHEHGISWCTLLQPPTMVTPPPHTSTHKHQHQHQQLYLHLCQVLNTLNMLHHSKLKCPHSSQTWLRWVQGGAKLEGEAAGHTAAATI